jgi:hypothetical protein
MQDKSRVMMRKMFLLQERAKAGPRKSLVVGIPQRVRRRET